MLSRFLKIQRYSWNVHLMNVNIQSFFNNAIPLIMRSLFVCFFHYVFSVHNMFSKIMFCLINLQSWPCKNKFYSRYTCWFINRSQSMVLLFDILSGCQKRAIHLTLCSCEIVPSSTFLNLSRKSENKPLPSRGERKHFYKFSWIDIVHSYKENRFKEFVQNLFELSRQV